MKYIKYFEKLRKTQVVMKKCEKSSKMMQKYVVINITNWDMVRKAKNGEKTKCYKIANI